MTARHTARPASACRRRAVFCGGLIALALLTAGVPAPARAGQVVLAPESTTQPYLFDALANSPDLKNTLTGLLTGKRIPPWARAIPRGGPFVGGPSRAVLKPPGGFVVYDACKQHDCGDNQLRILATGDGSAAWALLRESGRDRFLGAPGAAEKAILRAAFAP